LVSGARVNPAPSPAPAFIERLAAGFGAAMQRSEPDNFDHERYGEPGTGASRARIAAFADQTLKSLIGRPDDWNLLHDRLADDASRNWLLDLAMYRLLGHSHVRLPTNCPAFHAQCAHAKTLGEPGGALVGGAAESRRYQIAGLHGQVVVLDGWWFNIAWPFLLRQYFFERGGVRIAPRAGDCVIDAGACFGDTTLAFADAVGVSGQVHGFEVVPGNLAVARHNVALNPRFQSSVILDSRALGKDPGTLYLHGSGPGALVSADPGGDPVAVVAIDDYVDVAGLPRVDFIKMDIEGSESAALEGAIGTLRRWRPRLAISLYHHPSDLTRIPLWVDNLDLGYRLYLDHHTIHHEETVLYAVAE
jgi:FkbM family methyltransferase